MIFVNLTSPGTTIRDDSELLAEIAGQKQVQRLVRIKNYFAKAINIPLSRMLRFFCLHKVTMRLKKTASHGRYE